MPAECPICGAASAPEFRPFCSRRCAQVDLGRWLKESYRTPTDEPAEDAPPKPRDGQDD